MIQFYEIFKAGNPLIEKDIRNKPGLIDLCYSGVDLNEYEYSVFRRSKILYSDYFIQRKDKKKHRKQKRIKMNFK